MESNDSAYEIIIRNLEAEIREHIKVKFFKYYISKIKN
jgi:hypothetical protein